MDAATVAATESGCTCFTSPRLIVGKRAILARIPHGPKALRIDGITACSVAKHVVTGARTVVAADCEDHFDPQKGLRMVVPSASLQEMGYQAALYLFGRIWPSHVGAPLSSRTENTSFALLGETILFEIKLTRKPTKGKREGCAVMRCYSAHDGRQIMLHRFKFTSTSYALINRMVSGLERKVFSNRCPCGEKV